MEILKKIFKTFKNGGLASACVISRKQTPETHLEEGSFSIEICFCIKRIIEKCDIWIKEELFYLTCTGHPSC